MKKLPKHLCPFTHVPGEGFAEKALVVALLSLFQMPDAAADTTVVNTGVLTGNTATLQGDIEDNSVLVFDQAENGAYAGTLSGTGLLVKAGAGALELGSANPFGGATDIAQGPLRVGNPGALQDSVVFIGADGALDTQGLAASLGGLAGYGALDTAGQSLSVGRDNGSTAYAGQLSVGGLTKTGSSALALTNAGNSYGAGGITVAGGELSGNAQSLNAKIQVEAGATVRFNEASYGTFNQDLSGAGQFVKEGPGALVLTQANAGFTGTAILSQGVLQVEQGGALQAAQVEAGPETMLQYLNGAESGEGLALGGLAGSGGIYVSNGPLKVGQNNLDTAFSGTLSGASQLLKQGTGSLTLSGGTQGFTGETRIESGRVVLGDATALQRSTLDLVAGGGSLDTQGFDAEFGGLKGDGDLSVGAHSLTVGGSDSGSQVYSGALSVGGLFTKTGSGSLSLANPSGGRHSQLGGIVVDGGGSLLLGTAVLNSGAYTVKSGTLEGSAAAFKGDIATSSGGTVRFNQAGNGQFAHSVTGEGTFEKAGEGALALSQNQALRFGNLLMSGGSLNLGGKTFAAGRLTLDAGSIGDGTVKAGSFDLRSGTVNARLASAGESSSLSKSGAGQVVLGGDNRAFTGDIVLNEGSLVANSATALGQGAGRSLAVSGSAVLDLGASKALGFQSVTLGNAYSSEQPLIKGGQGLNASRFDLHAGTVSAVLGDAAGPASLSVQSYTGAPVTLTGANTYTGTTTIDAGTLQIGDGGTTGSIANSGRVVLNSGGELRFKRADPVDLGKQVLSGTGTLSQAGAGSLALSKANTLVSGKEFSGTTHIDRGKIILGDGDALKKSSVILNVNGGLDAQGKNVALAGLQGQGSLDLKAGVLTLATEGADTYDGRLTAGGLVKDGAGTLTLTNTGNAVGAKGQANAIDIKQGELTGNAASLDGGGGVKIGSGARLVFNQDTDAAFSPALSGNGDLVKSGSRTLRFTGSNVGYTGLARIDQGTVQIDDQSNLQGNIALNGGELRFARTVPNNPDIGYSLLGESQKITGQGLITQAGQDGLKLTNTNTGEFLGTTQIDSGSIVLLDADALANSTVKLNQDNGLDAHGNSGITLGGLEGGGSLDLGDSRLTVGQNGSDTQYDGALNAGGLTKTGGGTLALTYSGNRYGDGIEVQSGTVQGDTGSLKADIRVDGGATLRFEQAGEGAYSNTLSGQGQLAKTGSGLVTLDGDNGGFEGDINVLGGTLKAGQDIPNALGANYSPDPSGGAASAARSLALASAERSLSVSGEATLDLNGQSLAVHTLNLGSCGEGAACASGTITGGGGLTAVAYNLASGRIDVPLGDMVKDGQHSVLVKNDAGQATLGAANEYQGGTVLNGGTLEITHAQALGQGGLTFQGGTLLVNTGANTTLPNPISVASGGIAATSGQSLSLTGALGLQDNSRLTIGAPSGAGTVVLDVPTLKPANIPSSASLEVAGGTLAEGKNSALAALAKTLGETRIDSGATLDFQNTKLITTINNLQGSGSLQGLGALTLNNADFAGAIHGTGQLTQAKNGASVLSGPVEGFDRIMVGTGASATLTQGNQDLRILTVQSKGSLDLGGDNAQLSEATVRDNARLTLAGSNPKLDSLRLDGRLVLGGANPKLSEVSIRQGATLQLGNGGAGGSVAAGASLDNRGTLVFNRADTFTYAGAINSSGRVSQEGPGKVILTQANSYTGGTALKAGTLEIKDAGALSTGGLDFDGGGLRANLGPNAVLKNDIAVSGGGNALAVAKGQTLSLQGQINLQGSLVVGNTQDTGTLVLDAPTPAKLGHSASLEVAGGTLAEGKNGALGALTQAPGVTTTIGSGATLDFKDAAQVTIGNLQGFGTLASQGAVTLNGGDFSGKLQGAGALNLNGTATLSGALSGFTQLAVGPEAQAALIQGSAGLAQATVKAGGSLVLGGDYPALSQLSIGQAATVQLGNSGAAGSLATKSSVNNQGVLVFNRADNASFSGLIQGQGRVEQNGSGSLTLRGSNSYAGGTLVNSGTLIAQGQHALGSGPVTVNESTLIAQGSQPVNSGKLTINGGVLEAQAASLGGSIDNGGTLRFTQNQNSSYAGAISGEGTLIKQGAGVLSLAGPVRQGFTQVDAGTLEIGNSLSGNVLVNAARLSFKLDPATPAQFDGVISGTGRVVLAQGDLTLTAAHSYTGWTEVSEGATLRGNASSLQGDFLNYGSLNFKQEPPATDSPDAAASANGDGVFAGTVYGSGSVLKDGSGTLVLTGDNAYSGLTTIASGTLQVGNGGTSGRIVGDVANSGVLAFNRSDSLAYGGAVSGSGSLVQQGTGSLVLTGAHTYTGGTTVAAGTLQVGDGGTSGSLAGDVVNQGQLVFNRADASSFAGNISGNGSVATLGAGLLNLSGQVQAASFLNQGNVNYTGSRFAAPLDNQGSFSVNGAGTHRFSGDINNQGVFKVTNTTVVFDGTFVNNGVYQSDPSVNQFNNLQVGRDGYIVASQGDEYVVGGNFISASTQAAQWDTRKASLSFVTGADGNTRHSMQVNGIDKGANFSGKGNYSWASVSLAEGNSLNLLGTKKNALYTEVFKLGDGAKQLASVSGDTNVYFDPANPKNQYLLNGGPLSFGQGAGKALPWTFDTGLDQVAAAVFTPSQLDFAVALDQACAAPTGSLGQRCLELQNLNLNEKVYAVTRLTPDQSTAKGNNPIKYSFARAGNDLWKRLSDQRHGLVRPVSFSLNGAPVNANSLAALFGMAPQGGAAGDEEAPFRDSALGVFVQSSFTLGDTAENPGQRAADLSTRGVTIGADYRFTDKLVAGLSMSYTNVTSTFAQNAGNMESDYFTGSLYGSFYLPMDFYIDWLGSYGGQDYSFTRRFNYTGYAGSASSNSGGQQNEVAFTLGKDFAWEAWSFSPYFRVDYMNLRIDSYTEKGSSGFDMAVKAQYADSLLTDLGMQVSRAFSTPWGVLTPAIRAEWEHQSLNDNRLVQMRMIDASAGAGTFNLVTGNPDRDYMNLGGSLTMTLPNGGAGFVRYESRLGQTDITQNTWEVGVRLSF